MTTWVRACARCGDMFTTDGGRAFRCPSCQPVYRQAYNLHAASKHRAKVAGIPHTLSVQWIEQQLYKGCPRTGQRFVIGAPSKRGYNDRHPFGPSLDQVVPGAGYTEKNVQVVCWAYNCAKQQRTDEEVLELCQMVVQTARS